MRSRLLALAVLLIPLMGCTAGKPPAALPPSTPAAPTQSSVTETGAGVSDSTKPGVAVTSQPSSPAPAANQSSAPSSSGGADSGPVTPAVVEPSAKTPPAQTTKPVPQPAPPPAPAAKKIYLDPWPESAAPPEEKQVKEQLLKVDQPSAQAFRGDGAVFALVSAGKDLNCTLYIALSLGAVTQDQIEVDYRVGHQTPPARGCDGVEHPYMLVRIANAPLNAKVVFRQLDSN